MSALYQLVSIFKLSVNEKSYNQVKSFLRGPFGNLTPIFPHECVLNSLWGLIYQLFRNRRELLITGPLFFSAHLTKLVLLLNI